MYLEEQKIVHTNVRLANVFVSQHEVGSCFKVKLGDPGLPGNVVLLKPNPFFFSISRDFLKFFNNFFHHPADYTNESEVHWLSFELLIDSCPTASKCTPKGDVWAFATTLWELFSYGQSPTSLFITGELSLKNAKEQVWIFFAFFF